MRDCPFKTKRMDLKIIDGGILHPHWLGSCLLKIKISTKTLENSFLIMNLHVRIDLLPLLWHLLFCYVSNSIYCFVTFVKAFKDFLTNGTPMHCFVTLWTPCIVLLPLQLYGFPFSFSNSVYCFVATFTPFVVLLP